MEWIGAGNVASALAAAAAAVTVVWGIPAHAWTPLRIAGLCLAAPALVLWSIARFQLGRSFAVAAKATHLVSRGLYSKIRNPIYVFGSIFIAGILLMIGKPQWLLVLAALIPVQVRRARNESRVLEAKFGDEYRAYRSRTWF